MARILALDTTGEFGSLALVEEERIIEEVPLHSPGGHAHILYGHLERLLYRHGWTAGGIDCFAAASGPGSFTGVRVGLAAVKGLAEAAGRPAAPVSTLRALAWFGTAPYRAVFLDARRGEIYGAVYDRELGIFRAEELNRFPSWLVSLPEVELELISNQAAPFLPALAGTRFGTRGVTEAPRSLAGAVGRIAAADLVRGRTLDPAAVDANYVRRSDAELFWKDGGNP